MQQDTYLHSSTEDPSVTITDPQMRWQGSSASIATTPNAFSRTGSGTAGFRRSRRDRQAQELLLSTRDLVSYQGQFCYVVPSKFDLEHPNIVEVSLLPSHQSLNPHWSFRFSTSVPKSKFNTTTLKPSRRFRHGDGSIQRIPNSAGGVILNRKLAMRTIHMMLLCLLIQSRLSLHNT